MYLYDEEKNHEYKKKYLLTTCIFIVVSSRRYTGHKWPFARKLTRTGSAGCLIEEEDTREEGWASWSGS